MDLSKLTPADAAVTLRGIERRFRALLAGLGDDESPDDVAYRTVGGWSAADHIAAAARAVGAADRALAAVLRSDAATVPASVIDPAAAGPPAPGTSGSVEDRLAELGLEANAAADRISDVPARDWARTAIVEGSGRTVTALDIPRAAVDAVVTHVRQGEEVLRTVRGRPPGSD